jgi:hypothetical protein
MSAAMKVAIQLPASVEGSTTLVEHASLRCIAARQLLFDEVSPF